MQCYYLFLSFPQSNNGQSLFKNPKSIFRGFLSDYFLCQAMYVIYFLNSHFSKKVKGFIVKHTCLIFNFYGVHSGCIHSWANNIINQLEINTHPCSNTVTPLLGGNFKPLILMQRQYAVLMLYCVVIFVFVHSFIYAISFTRITLYLNIIFVDICFTYFVIIQK